LKSERENGNGEMITLEARAEHKPAMGGGKVDIIGRSGESSSR